MTSEIIKLKNAFDFIWDLEKHGILKIMEKTDNRNTSEVIFNILGDMPIFNQLPEKIRKNHQLMHAESLSKQIIEARSIKGVKP